MDRCTCGCHDLNAEVVICGQCKCWEWNKLSKHQKKLIVKGFAKAYKSWKEAK